MKQSFGRPRDKRDLMLRNLATSVILYESVVTTEAKGRVIQPIIDRLIRVGQSSDALIARRQLMAYLTDENAVKKILSELANRFEGRNSGFTRRYRLPARAGDGAPRVMVQLVNTVLLANSTPNTKKSRPEKVAHEESRHE